ncbi:MAG: HEAT repeat domain-containing protein, partial [bacterium]
EITQKKQEKNESKIVDRQKALEKRRAEIREKLREEYKREGLSTEEVEKKVEFSLWLIEDKVDILAAPKIIKEIKEGMKTKALWLGQAIYDLGQTRDPQGIPILIEVLRNYEVGGDRSYAASALEMIGDKSAIPALIEALEDRDVLVRAKVARVLAEMGEKTKSLPVLISLAKGENMDKWSIDLWGYGDFTEENLKKNIEKAKKGIRYEALRGLEKIGNDKAISVIKELSKDEDKNIQYIANRILKRLGIEGSQK